MLKTTEGALSFFRFCIAFMGFIPSERVGCFPPPCPILVLGPGGKKDLISVWSSKELLDDWKVSEESLAHPHYLL